MLTRWSAVMLNQFVRMKRAELVALLRTIGEVQEMSKADIHAFLGLPLSPDVF